MEENNNITNNAEEQTDVQDAQQPQTMADKLIALRQEWTAEVEALN